MSIIALKVNIASGTQGISGLAHCTCWLGMCSLLDERSLGGLLASVSFLFSSLEGKINGIFCVCMYIYGWMDGWMFYGVLFKIFYFV